ncbi:hypothetical protein FHW96_002171 [Novosphingobium sp. SG751A]|uniref:hypothetical protein n=1 Tax=Novosphingobium sp. SG751A TaxID=2587000 RepID=UPI0015559B93|nr:hypothetical protein [Novosphingobium sp. SG751A]NOW46013.1 hypothetical protein [Novosphingobium sp. SG751A]
MDEGQFGSIDRKKIFGMLPHQVADMGAFENPHSFSLLKIKYIFNLFDAPKRTISTFAKVR